MSRWLGLLVLFASQGCCTTLVWSSGVPRVHAEELLGAAVGPDGELHVGVAMSNGDERLYRHPLGARDEVHLFRELEREGDWRGAAGPSAETPPRVELTAGSVLVYDADGEKPIAWLNVPDDGGVDWSRPGAWAGVVVTPIAVAVDVATCPLQALFLLFFWPKC